MFNQVKKAFDSRSVFHAIANSTHPFASETVHGIDDIESLFLDPLIRKVVCRYPEFAYKTGFRIYSKESEVDVQSFVESVRNLDTLKAFCDVSIFARKYGNAYLFIETSSRGRWDKPLNFGNSERLLSLKVFNHVHCRKESLLDDFYLIGENRVHESRILKFSGVPCYNINASAKDTDASVIHTVFEAWKLLNASPEYLFKLLKNANQSIIKVKGLGQIIRQDLANKTSKGKALITTSTETLNETRDLFNLMMMDLDNEEFQTISQEYRGADAIYEVLKDYFALMADMPRSWLFEEFSKTGMGSGMQTQLVERFRVAERLQSWMVFNWQAQIVRLKNMFFDSRIIVEPNFSVQMTDLEKAELETQIATRNRVLTDAGIISIAEARNSYKTEDLELTVVLDEEISKQKELDSESKEAAPNTTLTGTKTSFDAIEREVLRDIELLNWDELATVSSEDVDSIMEDVVA